MKNRKGFTLIELLAVIVILGLLMAIAIPSVTKYITESRKKTLATTLGNYIGALVNDVNDLEYTFTGQNTIYAVPIECIALERGGTDPFGHWYQANDAYFAYVLVQYDDSVSKYIYGFTFKDSAGYGLYPTIQPDINEKGSQIKTGYTLNKPVTGDITSLTTLAKWQESGFKVDSNTHLQVLVATSENETGDGKETCTLQQKGDNYLQVEEEKTAVRPRGDLADLIKADNTLITATPTLTNGVDGSKDASGLYKTNSTINGLATYYFRGNVTNNNVEFAGLKWKVVRINEDGTVRLIFSESHISSWMMFNNTYDTFIKMYYSESNMKTRVDTWYKNNIIDKGYDSYVAIGTFCEQAKLAPYADYESGNAVLKVPSTYTPTFDCDVDGNAKGVLHLKVGLITYDEFRYAGSGNKIVDYYLYDENFPIWTMSPAGVNYYPYVWYVYTDGFISGAPVNRSVAIMLPVINLYSYTKVTGTGTSDDPYVVLTN